jgi:hypothetical protein
MSDRECGHSGRAQFWLDIEWVEPPNFYSFVAQAFVDKLSQAIKALPQREKK